MSPAISAVRANPGRDVASTILSLLLSPPLSLPPLLSLVVGVAEEEIVVNEEEPLLSWLVVAAVVDETLVTELKELLLL